MKTIMFSLIFLIGLTSARNAAAAATNEWGAVTNQLQMKIAIKAPTGFVQANSNFSLQVYLKNNSTNCAFDSGLSGSVNTDLYNGVNCVVISPVFGANISPCVDEESPLGANGFVYCKPGAVTEFEFKLGEICKLKSAGMYKVTAKKLFYYNGTNHLVVVSNVLFVKVVNQP